jgi:hypothetical protein
VTTAGFFVSLSVALWGTVEWAAWCGNAPTGPSLPFTPAVVMTVVGWVASLFIFLSSIDPG